MHESQICVTSHARWTNVPNMERFKNGGKDKIKKKIFFKFQY